MNSKLLKYPNIQYVMPILFNNALFIPIFNELFKDEINPVKYVYGTVRCAWAGGRISTLSLNRLDFIDKYLKKLARHNIEPTFTFSNIAVSKEQLNDSFCNNLLDIAYNNNSYFIVADDSLYNHIKSRYKDAKMVCSVVIPSIMHAKTDFDETKFYNEMLDKYEIVVLRPEWTNENIDKIDKVINDLDRVEVLINQSCFYNCPSAEEHYGLNSIFDQSLITIDEYCEKVKSFCPRFKGDYKSTYMSTEFVDKLVDLGVKKLKIQGRDYSFTELYNDIYNFMFNDKISKEDLLAQMDKISCDILKKNDMLQLNLV